MEFKLNEDWYSLLIQEFEKPYFKTLCEFLEHEYRHEFLTIFPAKDKIFNAFNQCPFESLKVVILGQDPYPTRGHAHGLSFSVQEHVSPYPKSLLNIFKEIQTDLGLDFPENGSLLKWAQQGVLLLNTSLTVREGKPGSHANIGWETFTDAVLMKLTKEKTGIVYILWGSKAIDKVRLIDSNNNLILTAPHPSPLSAYRGFFGCSHFSKTNEYLKKNGRNSIQW